MGKIIDTKKNDVFMERMKSVYENTMFYDKNNTVYKIVNRLYETDDDGTKTIVIFVEELLHNSARYSIRYNNHSLFVDIRNNSVQVLPMEVRLTLVEYENKRLREFLSDKFNTKL